MLTPKEEQILAVLRENPFISQQELADLLAMNRSTVATVLSKMMDKGYLLGRAYILNNAKDVICVGGMNLDRKYRIDGQMAPGTSNPVSSSLSLGGVARNIAESLGRLEQNVGLLSVAGHDHDYDWIRSRTETYVDLSRVTQLEGEATSSYTAILDRTGEMQLALADMDICDRMTPDWLKAHQALLSQSRLIVADLNLPRDTVEHLIRLARKEELDLVLIPVSGPKMTHLPEDLRGVKWLVVNQDESEAYFDTWVTSEADFMELAEKWLRTGLEQVLITRGAKPSYYAHQSGIRQFFAPPKVERIEDVTGAGDAFSAGLIYGLLAGKTAQESIAYGLTNAHKTIQTKESVRTDLSAAQLEADYLALKAKGVF